MAQRCIVYSRVSTDAQERDGTSLDTQEERSVACARERGRLVVQCVRDAASGFSLERPGLERVRSAVRSRQVDVVLAYALDRLSRKQTHIAILAEECADAGVGLEFVTESFEESATGQFLRTAKAFAAELEREKIAERTMRGKAQRARSGKVPQATGRGIYGYDYDPVSGTRRINAEQAAVVQRIFAQFCAGGSCHGIAVELRAEGIPTLSGSVWHPLTVRRILENETYMGRTVYRRTRVTQVRDPRSGKKRRKVELREANDWIEVPDATPAIVELSLFLRAQELLRDPMRRLRGAPTQLYPLRGHVRCLACATPMVGQALMKGQYRYYRCRRSFAGHLAGVCVSRYVRADLLEAAVGRELARVLADPARLLDEARRLNEASPELQRLEALAARLAEVEAQQRRLVRLYTSGALPDDVLAEESARLGAERQRLERERQALSAVAAPIVDVARLTRQLPDTLRLLERYVLEATPDNLTRLLDALSVEVRASHELVQISGAVPTITSENGANDDVNLVTIARTSA